jgi:hypothetical protein
VTTTARRAIPIESRLRENCTSGSVGRAEAADACLRPPPTRHSEVGKAGHLGKGSSVISSESGGEESLNSGAVDELTLYRVERRVLDHQRKLHRWARTEPGERFGDLFNLVCDQATLPVAWERVSGNRGARTAGVDAVTRRHVEEDIGVPVFLHELRCSLKDGTFTALPVRQVMIPKASGKLRALGIPTEAA